MLKKSTKKIKFKFEVSGSITFRNGGYDSDPNMESVTKTKSGFGIFKYWRTQGEPNNWKSILDRILLVRTFPRVPLDDLETRCKTRVDIVRVREIDGGEIKVKFCMPDPKEEEERGSDEEND